MYVTLTPRVGLDSAKNVHSAPFRSPNTWQSAVQQALVRSLVVHAGGEEHGGVDPQVCTAVPNSFAFRQLAGRHPWLEFTQMPAW